MTMGVKVMTMWEVKEQVKLCVIMYVSLRSVQFVPVIRKKAVFECNYIFCLRGYTSIHVRESIILK